MRYKFYSPVQGIIDYDFNKDMEYDAYFDEYCIEDLEKKDFDYLTGEDITVYEEYINQMIEKDLKKELDEGMGLMQYFNYGSREIYKDLLEKVTAAYPRIETVGDKAYGVMVCDIEKPLADQEIEILKDYFNGQYSDGWGEGFSQRGIETSYGVLYLDFWSDDFYIETEDELKNWTIVNKVDTIYKEKCRVQLLSAVPSTILLFHLVSSFRENYAVSWHYRILRCIRIQITGVPAENDMFYG